MIGFVYSPEFYAEDAEQTILGLPPSGQEPGRLLTSDQEKHLFRRMNFLRFKAVQIAQQRGDCLESKQLLALAGESRCLIVEHNRGLVASIAGKHAGKLLTHDEISSEGHAALLSAVDRFDYRRGFKFSTYASSLIRFAILKALSNARSLREQFSTGHSGFEVAGTGSDNRIDAPRIVARLLNLLEDRDRLIVSSRFGIGGERQTAKAIGDRLGLSDARVRGIESRALNRIRRAAQRLVEADTGASNES